jgi:hypothetical protein
MAGVVPGMASYTLNVSNVHCAVLARHHCALDLQMASELEIPLLEHCCLPSGLWTQAMGLGGFKGPSP